MTTRKELSAEDWQKVSTLLVLIRGGKDSFGELIQRLNLGATEFAWLLLQTMLLGLVGFNHSKQKFVLSTAGRDQIKLITPATRVNGHLERWR